MNNVLKFKPNKKTKTNYYNNTNNILKFKPKKIVKKNKTQAKLDYAFQEICYIMDNYKEKYNNEFFKLRVESAVNLIHSILERFLTEEESDLRLELLDNLIYVLEYSIKQKRLSGLTLIKC